MIPLQAVGNDTDGALRDFAAKCLAEFLKWSIKQTTTKARTDRPVQQFQRRVTHIFFFFFFQRTETAEGRGEHQVSAQAIVQPGSSPQPLQAVGQCVDLPPNLSGLPSRTKLGIPQLLCVVRLQVLLVAHFVLCCNWQTDVFGLEVLHNIIFSLSLAHHDDASLGTADRLATVILAFARVLVRNASALLKPNSQRRQHPDLRVFIDWLFTVHPSII